MKRRIYLMMMASFLFPLIAGYNAWAFEAVTREVVKEEVIEETKTVRTADNFIIVFDGSSSSNKNVPGMDMTRIKAAKNVLKQMDQWMPDLDYNCGVYMTSGWSALKTVHDVQPCTQASLGNVIDQLPEKGKGNDLTLQSMLKLEKVVEPLSGKTSVIWFTDNFIQENDDIRSPADIARRINKNNDVRFYIIDNSDGNTQLSKVADVNEGSEVIPLTKLLEQPDYLAGALFITEDSSYVKKTPVSEVIGYVTNDMLFDFDSEEIRPEYTGELDKLGRFLKDNPNAKVVIQGHTDNEGKHKYNLSLSAKRAGEVKKYLLKKFELDPGQISALWYGDQKPAADNTTEEGRKLNRRVEIAIKSSNLGIAE